MAKLEYETIKLCLPNLRETEEEMARMNEHDKLVAISLAQIAQRQDLEEQRKRESLAARTEVFKNQLLENMEAKRTQKNAAALSPNSQSPIQLSPGYESQSKDLYFEKIKIARPKEHGLYLKSHSCPQDARAVVQIVEETVNSNF